MKKKKRKKKIYCLLQGLNQCPNGAQENIDKIAEFAAKKYSSKKVGNALRVFYLKYACTSIYFFLTAVLCGPLGFEDFMRPDWMAMVLSWPDKRLGCFKNNDYKTLTELLNEVHEEDKPKEEFTGKNPIHKQKVPQRHGR